MTELFFGSALDGRTEKRRREREAQAKQVCFSCEYRLRCLERAMVLEETGPGVWGGMGESERRAFRTHMKEEGYVETVPEGLEFFATLRSFYRKRDNKSA